MARLSYTALTSLDGFIEDEQGSFDWAVPDAEVHGFINDLERRVGTHLYGRRMYETMAAWQELGTDPDGEPIEADFAEQWRALDKVVYSSTLEAVWTPRTQLVRQLDPEAVQHLKDGADQEISISGPTIAQPAFRAGLVDDVHLFVFPVVVGGGKPGLPRGVRLDLELVAEHRFASGVVHLHHRTR